MNKTEALLSCDTALVNHSELPVVSYTTVVLVHKKDREITLKHEITNTQKNLLFEKKVQFLFDISLMICDTFFMILKLKNHMTQRTFLKKAISFQQMTFKLYASYSYNNQTNKAI